MPPPTDFLDLIRRARSGDEAASAELVRHFEPFIQRVVRIRMGSAVENEVRLGHECRLVGRVPIGLPKPVSRA